MRCLHKHERKKMWRLLEWGARMGHIWVQVTVAQIESPIMREHLKKKEMALYQTQIKNGWEREREREHLFSNSVSICVCGWGLSSMVELTESQWRIRKKKRCTRQPRAPVKNGTMPDIYRAPKFFLVSLPNYTYLGLFGAQRGRPEMLNQQGLPLCHSQKFYFYFQGNDLIWINPSHSSPLPKDFTFTPSLFLDFYGRYCENEHSKLKAVLGNAIRYGQD